MDPLRTPWNSDGPLIYLKLAAGFSLRSRDGAMNTEKVNVF
jgi:hypothetical protein